MRRELSSKPRGRRHGQPTAGVHGLAVPVGPHPVQLLTHDVPRRVHGRGPRLGEGDLGRDVGPLLALVRKGSLGDARTDFAPVVLLRVPADLPQVFA